MSFVAIMVVTLESRVAKYMDFPTEAGADAHVAAFSETFPDAFTAVEPAEPLEHWFADVGAKTLTIVPPPPPDYDAIDQATVDRLLLDSGVMRALTKTLLDHENRIRVLEGQTELTVAQLKRALWKLIRGV